MVSSRYMSSCIALVILLVSASLALQTVDTNSHRTATSACASDLTATSSLQLDVPRLQETVRAGRVYQQYNFLTESQVAMILDEISVLQKQGAFARSGLSNAVRKEQDFGAHDRSICVVPWWAESLTATYDNNHTVAVRLQQLRLALSDLLLRPTMSDATLAHECYYSVAGVGSVLPRHMDERHEEMKGVKGWLLPSRRSISWLVYLSDESWELSQNGGALRSFPQRNPIYGATTQHEGNLQIGWLQQDDSSIPVFLDSWYAVRGSGVADLGCVLYRLDTAGNRVVITKPWLNDALQGISLADYLKEAGRRGTLFVEPNYYQRFALIEDRLEWDEDKIPAGAAIEDICPKRGSLVTFDSVLVPHQVEKIHRGQRIALAGWFHEETQRLPEHLPNS